MSIKLIELLVRNVLFFSLCELLDVLLVQFPQKSDDNVVIPSLIKHFPLEVNQTMLSGSDEKTDHFIGDDFVEFEQLLECDGMPALPRIHAVFPYYFAQQLNLIEEQLCGLFAPLLRFAALHGSTIAYDTASKGKVLSILLHE
jgi:hypothetical protein